MSAKWRQSQAWDDQHLTGWLWPVKAVLRAFSSIALAVVLLSLIALYGILASVPIGLLVKGLTYAFYGVTILAALALTAGLPALVAWRTLRSSRGLRFSASFAILIAGIALGAWAWNRYAWPQLHYDPADNTGVMFFADFIGEYKAVTLRRLPGMEMSELEFYAWWPLRLILFLFVTNMVVATVRRIDFNFKNIGVLTVHSGIVTIAIGSVWYNGNKLEGDTLLVAGEHDPHQGDSRPGPPQNIFYDNTRVALYADQFRGKEQRPLTDIPRYNDYNLAVSVGESAAEAARFKAPWGEGPSRPLDVPVPGTTLGRVDADIQMRVVGYASYAEPAPDFVRVPWTPAMAAAPGSKGPDPLRLVYLYSPEDPSKPDAAPVESERPSFAFTLRPKSPADRMSNLSNLFVLEQTIGASMGMPEGRWRALAEKLPAGTSHALVVEIPGEGPQLTRQVIPVAPGDVVGVANTGWTIEVKRIAPEPPFPIITEGYRGATSSVMILQITPPPNVAGGKPFERWVYHRFPEIAQDLLGETNERGMPRRRDADPAIRITSIEADKLNVYIDEPDGPTGRIRALVRIPNGPATVLDPIPPDARIPIERGLSLRVGERWEHAEKVERPRPVPALTRDNSKVGTHDAAMLAVEVWSSKAPDARRVVWLPFTRYLNVGLDTERTVTLPDGRPIRLAFGRRMHALPGFELSLLNFEMLAYDHRGSPRDYQSLVRVTPTESNFKAFDHVTQLNAPLTAPYHWDEKRSLIANIAGRLVAGLSPRQFKFSQAGWDRSGWESTQQLVDQGQMKKPRASFTILGVGNNPGIHVIALGGIMMGVGIPWAFYVKPWLVRREKARIQAELAAGTYSKPKRDGETKRQREEVVVS